MTPKELFTAIKFLRDYAREHVSGMAHYWDGVGWTSQGLDRYDRKTQLERKTYWRGELVGLDELCDRVLIELEKVYGSRPEEWRGMLRGSRGKVLPVVKEEPQKQMTREELIRQLKIIEAPIRSAKIEAMRLRARKVKKAA